MAVNLVSVTADGSYNTAIHTAYLSRMQRLLCGTHPELSSYWWPFHLHNHQIPAEDHL